MTNGEAREIAIRIRDHLRDEREREALALLINLAYDLERAE